MIVNAIYIYMIANALYVYDCYFFIQLLLEFGLYAL